jgi:hypothetical protein
LHPGPHPELVIAAWLSLQFIGGHLLCAILLMTLVISKKLKRHPTLYNLTATFILGGISDSLLYAISYGLLYFL